MLKIVNQFYTMLHDVWQNSEYASAKSGEKRYKGCFDNVNW